MALTSREDHNLSEPSLAGQPTNNLVAGEDEDSKQKNLQEKVMNF
jgi:hypothetical protein